MQWNRNFFTSGVLFSATFFDEWGSFRFTSSSRKRMLYLQVLLRTYCARVHDRGHDDVHVHLRIRDYVP